MRKKSKIIRKNVLVKPAGKRRIQKIESPGGHHNTLQVVSPKFIPSTVRKSVEIRKEKRGTAIRGFDWSKINFTNVEPIWKNETAFLIGGGPSLKGFDFKALQNKRTIAINKAFLFHPNADILYWTDSRFYTWYKNDIDKFKGEKYTIKPYGDIAKNIKVLKNTGKGGLEMSKSGVRHGNNSGHAAINLAYHLGVKRIILLGFDMQNVKGNSHFHEGYPVKQTRDETYKKSMIPLFLAISEDLKRKKIEVINACPNSELKCFKKLPLDKVLHFK